MAKTLDELLDYLNGLESRAALPELVAKFETLHIDCRDLREFVRFSDAGYTRNLVRQGEWFSLLVLCWKNGQRSPIHDHANSSCAVRVLRGVLTETTFGFAANGHVVALGSRELAEGSVCATQDSDLHQVSNLQAGDADLVTLHVYSPPLLWMGTYSIDSMERGREPMAIEFCDAAGI